MSFDIFNYGEAVKARREAENEWECTFLAKARDRSRSEFAKFPGQAGPIDYDDHGPEQVAFVIGVGVVGASVKAARASKENGISYDLDKVVHEHVAAAMAGSLGDTFVGWINAVLGDANTPDPKGWERRFLSELHYHSHTAFGKFPGQAGRIRYDHKPEEAVLAIGLAVVGEAAKAVKALKEEGRSTDDNQDSIRDHLAAAMRGKLGDYIVDLIRGVLADETAIEPGDVDPDECSDQK